MARSGKSHNHNHEQHAKPKHNSHEKDTKPNSALPRKPSFIGRMLRFFFSSVYYLAIITILLSTVSIGYNCAEGGKQIAGSKPLCADLTKLTQFTKPSDQFISNLRNTYGTVLSNYRKRVVHTTWNLSGIIKENYKSFSRSDIGVAVEKYLYKIHAFVVENALLVKRFVERKWADVTKWYNAEGHKTFGGVVNAVKVGANMAIEVCKDIMVFVRETVVALLARIESFVHIWMEKGFSAAWKTVA